jgi:hypothetical protein
MGFLSLGRLMLALTLGVLVSGCGRQSLEGEPRYRIPEDTSGSPPTFVKSYGLTTASSAPKGPGGTTPFAVLINLDDSSFSRCTATHWAEGLVLTNAHCVDPEDKPENLFLIYWNKSGEVKWAAVTSILGRGTEDTMDAAFLAVSEETAAGWHSFQGGTKSTDSLIGKPLGESSTAIEIWAMNHHGTSPYYYSELKKKVCKATPRTKIQLTGVRASGVKTDLVYNNEDESIHIFYDSCVPGTIGGNSGSLVVETASGKAVGIHFSSEKKERLRDRYVSVEITGSDGILKTLSTATDGFISGTGVAMESLLSYFIEEWTGK